MSALDAVSRRPDGPAILGLGPRGAGLAKVNLSLETSPCAPAHQLFTGVLYEAARLDSIAEEEAGRRVLERHCIIFSGLWGVLSPTDPVPDHRLLMGTSLPGPGRLSAFWKPHLATSLIEPATRGLTIDCRSADYAAAWKPSSRDGVEVVTVRVERVDGDGTRRVVSHMAKRARGLLTGALLSAVSDQTLSAEACADDVAALAARLNGVDDVEVFEADRQAAGPHSGDSLTTMTSSVDRLRSETAAKRRSRLSRSEAQPPSGIHPYDDDVVLLSVDDLILGGGGDARQLLGTDLNESAFNAPSPERNCAKTPGGAAHRLIVGQEGRLNGAGQVRPLALQGVDLLIEASELGIAFGGELASSDADVGLLPTEALHLFPGSLQSLHGSNLHFLQRRLTLPELIDLSLNG